MSASDNLVFIKEGKALYASVNTIAAYMELSTDTVRRIIKEMEEYRIRYAYGIGKSGGILRVDILAFVDYFTHRDDFKHDRPVPPYDPINVRRHLGILPEIQRVAI